LYQTIPSLSLIRLPFEALSLISASLCSVSLWISLLPICWSLCKESYWTNKGFIASELILNQNRQESWQSSDCYCCCCHPYISLINSVELSPSWEFANYAVTQELPNILWNPKVHYRLHKSPLLVLILSQNKIVLTTTSYLCNSHFNIIHHIYGSHSSVSWLRTYATSRNVVGLSRDEVIGIYNWPNPSNRTMALESIQPVTEMSTRNLPGRWRAVGA
jgi:hypothetical protein